MNTFKPLPRAESTIARAESWPADISMTADQEAPNGMSVLQLLAILRAHWIATVVIAAVVTGVSAFTIKFLPKTYTATATLIVDEDKKDPLAGSLVPENSNFSGYVATQMELIQSPSILIPVVDRMHLTEDRHFTVGYRGQDPAGLRQYTAQNLAWALQVDLGRGGQLLYIAASARDPTRAADIANTVADVYVEAEQRRLSGPAGERATRYAHDLVELRAKVAAAQDKLTAFRQQHGITDAGGGSGDDPDPESQTLKSLEDQLLEAQNTRRSLEAKRSGQQSSSDEVIASGVIQGIKGQLAAQQTQLAQLTSTYGPKHPKVLELKSQITLTQQQLNKEMQNLSENVSTQLARAKELESKFQQAVAVEREKVMGVREQQGEGAKLQLELDSAQSVYKRALDGYDQIMFASAGNNTNVSLVNRATPPMRYSKPNKSKLLLFAVMAGLSLGLVAPFLYELFLDRRLRCRDDMERGFRIPVLAQFDKFSVGSGVA